MEFLEDFGQDSLEDIRIHLLNQLLLSIRQTMLPSPLLPSDPHLIVPVPQANRGMVSDPLHIVSHFCLNVGEDIGRAGVECACEHEIVPDEYSCLIHALVELVLLELPTSPQADHVEPAEQGVFLYILIDSFVGPGEGHLRRDVVATAHVDVVSVQIECKRSAVVSLAGLLDDADGPDACVDGRLEDFLRVQVDQFYRDCEKIGLSEVPCPPDAVPDVCGDVEGQTQRGTSGRFDGQSGLVYGYVIDLAFYLKSEIVVGQLVEVAQIKSNLAVNALDGLIDLTMSESQVIDPCVIIGYDEDLLPNAY